MHLFTKAYAAKKGFHLSIAFLLVVVLLTLTACSGTNGSGSNSSNGSNSSKKGPLNATNFIRMADSEGYIYGFLFGSASSCAIKFTDSNHIHLSHIDFENNEVTILQEDPVDYSDNHYEFITRDDNNWAMKKNAVKEYSFRIQYADPDGQYLILLFETEGTYNAIMRKNVFVNALQNNFYQAISDWHNLDEWIAKLDSWK